MDRTELKGDTQLTQRRSGPVRYEVVDQFGSIYSPQFDSAFKAAQWAKTHWPDQEQDPDRTGRGWDISVVEPDR